MENLTALDVTLNQVHFEGMKLAGTVLIVCGFLLVLFPENWPDYLTRLLRSAHLHIYIFPPQKKKFLKFLGWNSTGGDVIWTTTTREERPRHRSICAPVTSAGLIFVHRLDASDDDRLPVSLCWNFISFFFGKKFFHSSTCVLTYGWPHHHHHHQREEIPPPAADCSEGNKFFWATVLFVFQEKFVWVFFKNKKKQNKTKFYPASHLLRPKNDLNFFRQIIFVIFILKKKKRNHRNQCADVYVHFPIGRHSVPVTWFPFRPLDGSRVS